MFFVNLALRDVYRNPEALDGFLAWGVDPELGLDPVLMDTVNMGWHREVAARLAQAGRRPSLHLPFFDLQPGSADALILAAGRERLRLAMEVAKIYRPAHMVGHASYDALLYVRSYDRWRARAETTWLSALEAWPEHPPLYLENTFEPAPETVAGMVAMLAESLGDRVGLCLDVGHWFSFAGGWERDNLEAWLDACAPHLRHLHLHDNDGSVDAHRGLGQGAIPWESLFEGLSRRGLMPSVTFEPHDASAHAANVAFTAERPDWFRPLGVR